MAIKDTYNLIREDLAERLARFPAAVIARESAKS
jgi:hypothetical protein